MAPADREIHALALEIPRGVERLCDKIDGLLADAKALRKQFGLDLQTFTGLRGSRPQTST